MSWFFKKVRGNKARRGSAKSLGIPLARECPVCKLIAKTVLQWSEDQSTTKLINQPSVKLGSWQGFLDRQQCNCCLMIVRRMRNIKQYEVMFEPACTLTLRTLSDCFWICSDKEDDHNNEYVSTHPHISLVPSYGLGLKIPYFIPVDSGAIDLVRLSRWPSYCDKNHRGSCHSFPQWQSISNPSSITLIDIQRSCLVQIEGQVKWLYVALSYVWGNVPGVLESRNDNFSQLCSPGSLNKPENMSRMPRTVLDAMTVSIAMGVQYLWVDRLCIIQDNPTSFAEQMQQMASIYANSCFTIIAADGPDANYGLPGVCANSSPRSRSFNQEPFKFSTEVEMVENPEHESIFNKPAWHSRAWTFQERALSPRTLVFTGSTVYWACRRGLWHETVAGELHGYRQLNHLKPGSGWPCFQLKQHLWPDMKHYFDLVEGYNTRKMSFESDALNAFSAITTAMSKSFPGGFLFGIPTFLFDIGILWSRASPLTRRKGFPSWSWLGWSGRVNVPYAYLVACDPVLEKSGPVYTIEVVPLVNWYVTDRYGCSDSPIDNSYHQYTSAIHQPDAPLPQGWAQANDIVTGCNGFAPSSFPENVFKFPFPVSSSVMKFSTDILRSYLKFRAKSCTLQLGGSRSDTRKGLSTCLTIDLQDSGGLWVGVVDSLLASEKEYIRGYSCEAIAVSRGYAERKDWRLPVDYQAFDEMNEVDEIKNLSSYKFYNVLWIETIEGISYRKAVGRVWADAWERLPTKDVDILLG